MSEIINPKKIICLEYYPAPRYDEERELSRVNFRGVVDFVGSLENGISYKVAFYDGNCKLGGAHETLCKKEIFSRVKVNWSRLTKIVVKEYVIV